MADDRLKRLKNQFFLLQEHGIYQKEIAYWIKNRRLIRGYSQPTISRLRADSSLTRNHIELLAYLEEMIEELKEKGLYFENSLECSDAQKKEIRQLILRDNSQDKSEESGEAARAQWKSMEMIGPWEIIQDEDMIIGEGVERYLLSQQSYGSGDFTIFATVGFDFVSHPEPFNAGFILGWKEPSTDNAVEKKCYHNLLFFSDLIVLEAVGFQQGGSYRDFNHLSAYETFEIQHNHFYDVVINVHSDKIDLFMDNQLVFSTGRPRDMYGKAGIRPWRSRMILKHFSVHEGI